jgi:hypothetical protein
MDLVEVFIELLEAENLKSKNLADEYPAFGPAPLGEAELRRSWKLEADIRRALPTRALRSPQRSADER